MTQYIDAEKLKELICGKWKELADKNVKVGGGKWDAEISTYLSVLRLIESLQQEQSELPGYNKALLEVKGKVDELYEETSIGLSEYDSGLYNGIAETCMKLRGFIKARLDSDEQPEMDVVSAAKVFLDALSKTPYNNKPITDAQIIVKQLLLFFETPSNYNPDAIVEQPKADYNEFEKLFDDFCERHKGDHVTGHDACMWFWELGISARKEN